MTLKKLKWGLLAGLLAATPFTSSAAVWFQTSADDSILSGLAPETYTQTGSGAGPCTANGFQTCSGSYEFVEGSLKNKYSAPGTDSGNPWPGIFLTVPKPTDTGFPLTADLQLGSAVNQFGMLWGSVDTYNKIEFLNGGVSVGAAINGLQIAQDLTGDSNPPTFLGGNFDLDAYVLFTSDIAFDTIRFTAKDYAFESADHRYQVPEPMTLGLLALGLLGMGLMGRRRSSARLQA